MNRLLFPYQSTWCFLGRSVRYLGRSTPVSPRFWWDLSALPPDGHYPGLDAKTATSIANARDVSRNDRNLDLNQQEAVVDNLTGEISLIPGPPNTGKFIFLTSFRLASSFWVFPGLYRDLQAKGLRERMCTHWIKDMGWDGNRMVDILPHGTSTCKSIQQISLPNGASRFLQTKGTNRLTHCISNPFCS